MRDEKRSKPGVRLVMLISDDEECYPGKEEAIDTYSALIGQGDVEVRNATDPDDPWACDTAKKVLAQEGMTIPSLVAIDSNDEPIFSLSAEEMGLEIPSEPCSKKVREKA